MIVLWQNIYLIGLVSSFLAIIGPNSFVLVIHKDEPHGITIKKYILYFPTELCLGLSEDTAISLSSLVW